MRRAPSKIERVEMPQQFIDLAKRRTADFVHYRLMMANTEPLHIAELAAESYLQGAADAQDALERAVNCEATR